MDAETTSTKSNGSDSPVPHSGLLRRLSFADALLLIMGGVVGSAIFLTPKDVAAAFPSPFWFFFAWAAGGAVAIIAGLAFGELGAMYPEAGGQYVYLREAFGNFFAFEYGWLMFVAGVTGGNASIAVAFAQYTGKAFPALSADRVLASIPGFTLQDWHLVSRTWHLTAGDALAVLSIAFLTAINVVGLRPAVLFQNLSAWLKYAALAVFLVFGIASGNGSWSNFSGEGPTAVFAGGFPAFMSILGVAFIAVFWTYDGWVYVSWAAGEIQRPERNVPRSLVLGILGVVVLYLAMNVVYVYAMPLPQIAQESAVAQSVATRLFSPAAAFWLSLLIAVSCLGATSSCILAGARVSYAMGRDGLFFRSMGKVHPRYHTPAVALVVQGIWSALIAVSGTYDQLFTYTTFGMVLSYVAGVVALFVLRRKRPGLPRPYRCFGYPWLPAIYVLLIGGWVVNTVVERPHEAYSCIGLLALGVPGYLYWKRLPANRVR